MRGPSRLFAPNRDAVRPSTACMGGGCSLRDRCLRHHAVDRLDARERICDRGADGIAAGAEIRLAPMEPGPKLSDRDRAAVRARCGL